MGKIPITAIAIRIDVPGRLTAPVPIRLPVFCFKALILFMIFSSRIWMLYSLASLI